MGALEDALEALSAARDGAELRQAAHGVTSAVCTCGGDGREAAAARIAQSGVLSRALQARELCEAALSAVAILLPALSGVAPPPDSELDDCDVAAGDGGAGLFLMRVSPDAELSVLAAQSLWEATGPFVNTVVDAHGQWSLRYRAARCILMHDAILALSPEAANLHPAGEKARGMLAVARLATDPRAQLKQLGLHAVVALLLSDDATCGQERALYCKKAAQLGALAWIHLAKLVENETPAVAQVARKLLSSSGYPTTGDVGDPGGTHGSAGVDPQPGSHQQLLAEASGRLAAIGARRALPLLTRSLGLLSPSHHCGAMWQEDGSGGGEGEEETLWRHELERQSVPARLAAVKAIILALRSSRSDGAQHPWGVHQEIALLVELRMATGKPPSCQTLNSKPKTQNPNPKP